MPHPCVNQRFFRYTSQLAIAIALMLTGCSNNQSTTSNETIPREARIAKLHIVDCLLPGQVRMLGGKSYITPRRPAVLSAAECDIRGGEYVAYDRADYKTALAVWLPAAEEGDADAQVNVGEIFEKGVGGTPNYQAAFIWYEKAAKKGNARGQFNLGTLYEQGLGVEKDSIAALSWYRKAWGLPEDNLIFQSSVDKQQAELLKTINADIRKKDLQIKIMNQQLAELNASMQKQKDNNELTTQIQELQNLVNELESEAKAANSKKVALEASSRGLKLRTPQSSTALPAFKKAQGEDIKINDINFGKFYALVIGNQDYEKIENLDTPINDINAIANILENQYDFQVQKVINADDVGIMEAINNINNLLTENDNLLIYYAGHGARLQSGNIESGYWLPTNAEAPPRDTFWVANEFVTRHLARINAKRVLVVADSCYSGLLSSAPGFLMMGDDGRYTNEYIKYKAPKRSRLLLASGGDFPVLDSSGDTEENYSIFTKAFLDTLSNNNKIISAPQLFMEVRSTVKTSAQNVGFEQTPIYKTIKGAGHEVGDFFFIPKNKS